jgi:DNA polymerase-3 subunit epsilon
MKKLFIDTESTGLKPDHHELVQLAGIVEGEEFNFFCRPMHPERIDSESLVVINKTLDEIMAYPDPKDTFLQFIRLLEKYADKYTKGNKINVYAFNAPHDIDFIYSFFRLYSPRTDDKVYPQKYYPANYMSKVPCCVLQAYRFTVDLGKLPVPPNYKLTTLCDIHGIKLNAHNALSDAKATMELYKIIRRKHELEFNGDDRNPYLPGVA